MIRVLLVLLGVFTKVTSAGCRSQYECNFNACFISYGSNVSVSTEQSAVACGTKCNIHQNCRSWLYGLDNKNCYLNQMARTPSTFPSGCSSTYRFCNVLRSACRDTFLHVPCASDNDCTAVQHTRCNRNNVCGCSDGYSYRFLSDDCHGDCPVYGNTWKEEYYYMHGSNLVGINTGSKQGCRDRCITYLNCRFVEYVISNGMCYLSHATAYSKPAFKRPENNPNWVQFLRNCA